MRRNTDAENAFGDVMPSATVHICPVRKDDVALKIESRETIADERAVFASTVMVTATHEATGITATYITIPVSSAVFIDITATWTGSGGAGSYEASGSSMHLMATVVASGVRSQIQGQTITNPVTAISTAAISVSGMATGNYVPVVLHGVASNELTWGLKIDTFTVYCEHI